MPVPTHVPLRDTPLWARWWYASKPGSWSKLLVPALLGQAYGAYLNGHVDARALAVGMAFTVLDLLFIVFLNDWSDRRIDALKRSMFPNGCSPKTIPDGILSANALLTAGLLAGLGGLCLAFYAQTVLDRPWALGFAAGALGIFAAYSLPPVQLNYRGGGEILEMLGVGAALPLLQAYLQSGQLTSAMIWLCVPYLTLSLASAIASGLSDQRSDQRGGKTTFVTAFGNASARAWIGKLALTGAFLWPLCTWQTLPIGCGIAAFLLTAYHWQRMQSVSEAAITDAFGAQKRYKHELHMAIWRPGYLLTAFLTLSTVYGIGS